MGNPDQLADRQNRFYREHLVALHGFIKKTQATPEQDLALARKRQKELMQ